MNGIRATRVRNAGFVCEGNILIDVLLCVVLISCISLPYCFFAVEEVRQAEANTRRELRAQFVVAPEALAEAMQSPRWQLRLTAVRHPNATPEVLAMGMEDEHVFVRLAAFRHPSTPPELKALAERDGLLLMGVKGR